MHNAGACDNTKTLKLQNQNHMKFNTSFKEKVLQFNGQTVDLSVIHISSHNHPLGQIGMMFMGTQQTERVELAVDYYNGVDALIVLKANMDFIITEKSEKIVFTINDFECNKIEIFRPNPPMMIEDKDMSLWWTYYNGNDNNHEEGDSFPIRDILINGISHCLQPLD